MRFPKSLETLADHGVIEEVLRPLMSGKEAQIYLVVANGEVCAAKIYKDAQTRSFKNRADYVEGRKVRNSRDQRAITKGTKYGKSRDEDAWRSTEVEMIYRLREANVRVPTPHTFIDGVLVMELVQDPNGHPAPRLGDLHFTADEALHIYHLLLNQVVRMLCAGVVHGDLSDFNVLLAWDGPVIIDFPQSVNAAGNQNARALLLRDVGNLHRFASRFVPGFRRRPYAEEMWSLYENNRLTPETELSGNFRGASGPVDTRAVLELIGDANRDEERRRGRPVATEDAPVPAPRRREIVINSPTTRNSNNHGARRHGGPGVSPERSNGQHGQHAGPGQNQAGPRHAGPGHAGPGHHPRGPDSRGGHPGPRIGDHRGGGPSNRPRSGRPVEPQKGGPKRGASATTAVYISPEARKVKVSTLTPKNLPEEKALTEGRHGESQRVSARPSREPADAGANGDARPRRRRRRGRNGPPGSSPQS
jgi:RIO kinase 1